MYGMVDKEYIRKKHYVEGWSIREISKSCKVARQTVRKMLKNSEIPQYTLTKPRPRPVMEQWLPIIETWLREDEAPSVPKKQRHTSARIHERLKEEYPEEFTAAESTVRHWVARIRNKKKEAFIPLTADAGELAEVDFGHVVIKLGNETKKVCIFVMRMRSSGVPFAHAFHTEKLEAFLEGHRLAFEWFGGVPGDVRYDNPKTAVTKILAGPLREEHQLLSSLRAHYLFDSDFCRPGEPHEKGGVENSVGYVRRNTCVPVPDVPDLDALNAQLLDWCTKQRDKRWSEWEQEQLALRPLPTHPYRCATAHPVVVNKLCLVNFERNRYSVPSIYVGKTLTLMAYAERIEVLDRERVVATHVRCHDRNETFLELDHYLPVLAYKPHAATHAAVVRQLPEVYQRIRRRMTATRMDGYKDFVAILQLHRTFSPQDILRAIEDIGPDVVTADQIRAKLLPMDAAASVFTVPDELKQFRTMKQNPARYDSLTKRVIH
ncbi:IS21 family transposase [Alicyclobacillus sp. SO9]|uniref:IS21 family transposase n=1 Tax=Alicyclobacillus sp. SO9 TaxID=2665646 RepID=UPI0018E88394|nr:IS21 family transposase [Alicyclobacillus sp. SO9]QQE81541.1 IS21 family transposase [Alicyclobacillus sp. SO9]